MRRSLLASLIQRNSMVDKCRCRPCGVDSRGHFRGMYKKSIHVYVYIYIYISTHTQIYIYMCIYIYIYAHFLYGHTYNINSNM